MNKVAILGNAGGGKSVLARRLGESLHLPVHAIDDAQWKAGWQAESPERVAELHARWLATPRWIIEGWGEWRLIEQRIRETDTIILIDFPTHVHVRWVLKRQVQTTLGLSHHWPPNGCSTRGVTRRLLRTIRYVDRELRPRLFAMLERARASGRLVHLQSPRQLRAFAQRFR